MSVIKSANAFVTLQGSPADAGSGMRRVVRSIPNGEPPRPRKPEAELPRELQLRIANAEKELNSLVERRDEILGEYEVLRNLAIRDGDMRLEAAKAEAAKLTADTELECAKIRTQFDKDLAAERESVLAEARSEGYDVGYGEGREQGGKDGYAEGLASCEATLDDMMSVMQSVAEGKEVLFRKYENQLFDIVFAVANRITLDMFKQSDKAAIAAMIADAAKEHRDAQHVTVRLAAVDINGEGIAELESLDLFEPKQNVEFVIDREAAAGSVIIEDDTTVTDASVAAQLKMIEGLGRGQFRD